MPKEQNIIQTKKVTISTTPQIVKHLEKLVKTGYYGKNVAEAADRLLSTLLESQSRANDMTVNFENEQSSSAVPAQTRK